MRKIILALMVTFMLSMNMNAQSVNVKVESHLKSAMCLLVAEAKTTYKNGASYDEWKYELYGENLKFPKEQDELLQDVYGFLSSGANSETIYKNYDGNSLLNLAKFKGNGGEMATSNRCGFWCKLLDFLIDLFFALLEWLLSK